MAKEDNKEEKIDTSTKKDKTEEGKEDEKEEDKAIPLDKEDIQLLMRYGRGPYFDKCKDVEEELKDYTDKIIKL